MLLFGSNRHDLPDGSSRFVIRSNTSVFEELLDRNSTLLGNGSDCLLDHLHVFGWRHICGGKVMLFLELILSSELGICPPKAFIFIVPLEANAENFDTAVSVLDYNKLV